MPFPVEERFIVATEQKLGVKLPPDYVQKMRQANGGAVNTSSDAWLLYPILDTSDKKRLKRTCNDVVKETQNAREWPDFPEDAVAIGSNGGGDQLVLLRDKNSPSNLGNEVFWWDHETGELYTVAASFDELVAD